MDAGKLKFEMIPDGCWGYNLRSVLTREQWDGIKKVVKSASGGKCSVCGAKTTFLDAHERWEYDTERGIIKLKEIVPVCKDCHAVIHYGRTSLKGDPVRAENHYMKVNGATYAEFRAALGEAERERQKGNLVHEWKMDLSFLKTFLEK